ncbi:MAG TPA: ParB N-terminal domain-containing protein, partial [Chloroflexota bacterium]
AAHRPVDDRPSDRIPIARIDASARNPRQKLDGTDELAASLAAHGLLQPIVVRRLDIGYEIIAGHRRLAAAQQLGWTEIAAVIRDESDERRTS